MLQKLTWVTLTDIFMVNNVHHVTFILVMKVSSYFCELGDAHSKNL